MNKKGHLPKTCQDCGSLSKGIFCDLNDSELVELSKHKVSNQYKKGQTLFLQGNPSYGLYCISTGKVKIVKIGDSGKETLVRIASAGDIVGHRSLFSEDHYSTTATVLEDASICFLDKKYIIKAVQEKPSVSYHIIEKLSRDMGAAEDKVFSMYQKNVRERLSELLLFLKETYGESENQKIKLNIKLTREEMASMIGTASETLIRFMTELKEENVIEQEGKTIYIIDEQKLLEFANIPF